MKCEVVPSEISSVVKFTPSSHSSYLNESIESTFGRISKSGLWLYIVHDTIINIYCTESGKWQGGHCFGESLKNPSAKITAAVECTSSHLSFPCLLLAIKQDHESLLCMFDVNSCKVSQAVLVPDRVTSLDIVSGNGGVCIETHNLCRRLRYMFGIVAVGTRHGHVFFLDLCLDEDFSCSELLPNITAVVKKNDFSPQKREIAVSKKQHIFLHLNEESTSGSSFEFKSRSSILGRFANGDVSVTAVKYIQSLTTLTVGFNFGGIQLWDLHTLMLQFTISDDQHEQAIVSFAFQEPENDPRNFCYLWVVKGHSVSEEALPSSVSVATLYSLTYFKRDFRDGFGALYSELQTCNKRFELPLTSGTSGLIGTRLLACQVISQKETLVSINDSDSVSEDMSVCFLSWEVWPDAEQLPPSYHLAVFDLNQWYQAHMPFNFRYNPNELNSYLGIFSLGEISRKFNNDCIMDLYSVPQSVKKFKSLSVSEEFFYPSSLGFHLMCFSESGQCKATYFGFQRRLLFEIAELGPQVLLNPKEIYSSLIKCGLVSDLHGGVERTPLTVQKEAVLELALEYYLPFFFMKCLKEWRYSDSIHEGCTSKAILSWAWKKVINIKNSIDRLCVPLFNCSGADVDKASLKNLYSFRRQLTLIDSIIEGYQKYVTPRTEQGIQELHCRKYVISSINMYLRVILWLRSVHVLPEVCEEEATARSVVYRAGRLEESFLLRRSRLQKIHSSLSSDDVFLIDGMVAESGVGSSWLEKNGSGLYPPPSVYAALGCYLLDGVDVDSKHALVFYLLLDLQDMNPESQFPVELKKFPIVFGMSKGLMKIVQAFWYLDRKDSENAMKKLLHPAVRASDILPWQHVRIIKSFLYWREPQKALKYILHMEPPQSTIEDMKLHLSVLLACGAITQAYEYQRKKQLLGFGNELLNHLFLGCQEMQKLKDLMNLPLNSFESSALVKFLSESEDPRSQESLVIYHLLHCNLFQAAKVNEKLSRTLMNKLSSVYEAPIYERSVDRDALVESLMAAISKPEKCLVEEMKQFSSDRMKLQDSQPLSASVKGSAVKAMTYSDILKAVLQKSFKSRSVETTTNVPSSANYYQDLPFIGPPVTPECVKQQVTFRSSVVPKRSRLSSSPTDVSSPAKRSRLLDNVPFNATPLSKRKTPKNLAGDIVSLLQTPPIHRRISNLRLSNTFQATPTITPQSILKKKTEKTLEFHLAETPPLCSEDDSSEEDLNVEENQCASVVDVETPSRQIRFDLPDSPAQEPSPSPKPRGIKLLKKDSNLSESFTEKLKEAQSAAHESSPKPLGNLTREPLRSQRKDVSFQEEMEVEEPVRVPVMLSAIYERSVPTFSFMSDSGIATSTKCMTPPVVLKEPDSSNEDSFLPDPLLSRSSYLSPQPAVKSDSFSTPLEDKLMDTGSDSGLDSHKKTLMSEADKDVLQTPYHCSYNSVHDPLGLSVAEEEHSDNDMFYSPSTDNYDSQSFTFSQPITLFPETGSPVHENTQYVDFIEADYSLVESSSESNKTLTFAFSEPSIDNEPRVTSSAEPQCGENKLDDIASSSSKDKGFKPSRKTFVFSRSTPAETKKTTEILEAEAPLQKESSKVEEKPEVETSFTFKVPLTTEKNQRKSKAFVFGKVFASSGDENEKVQQVETSEMNSSLQVKAPPQKESMKPKEETSFSFKVPSSLEKMPRKSRTFVFGKNFSIHRTETESEDAQQVKKSYSNFVFKTPQTVKPPARPSFSIPINEAGEMKEDSLIKDENVHQDETKSVFSLFKSGSDARKTFQSFNESALSFLQSEAKSRSSRKTFVFTKSAAASESASTQTKGSDSIMQDTEKQSKNKSEFMNTAAETYEEFSCSLKKKGSEDGLQQDDQMTALSSPFTDTTTTSSPQDKTEKKKLPKKKRIVKEKVSKAVGTTPGLIRKKNKDQLTQKIEFSFAEPTSPATPEILEALAKSPEPNPLPSFLFSPPLTRGRLRKKRLNETTESSFCSEASFARPKTPPIDPLLQGIMDEKGLGAKTTKSTTKKRGGGRKTKLQSQLDISDVSSNTSVSLSFSQSPSKRNSSARDTSMRHSMVLRQAKHKPDTLF